MITVLREGTKVTIGDAAGSGSCVVDYGTHYLLFEIKDNRYELFRVSKTNLASELAGRSETNDPKFSVAPRIIVGSFDNKYVYANAVFPKENIDLAVAQGTPSNPVTLTPLFLTEGVGGLQKISMNTTAYYRWIFDKDFHPTLRFGDLNLVSYAVNKNIPPTTKMKAHHYPFHIWNSDLVWGYTGKITIGEEVSEPIEAINKNFILKKYPDSERMKMVSSVELFKKERVNPTAQIAAKGDYITSGISDFSSLIHCAIKGETSSPRVASVLLDNSDITVYRSGSNWSIYDFVLHNVACNLLVIDIHNLQTTPTNFRVYLSFEITKQDGKTEWINTEGTIDAFEIFKNSPAVKAQKVSVQNTYFGNLSKYPAPQTVSYCFFKSFTTSFASGAIFYSPVVDGEFSTIDEAREFFISGNFSKQNLNGFYTKVRVTLVANRKGENISNIEVRDIRPLIMANYDKLLLDTAFYKSQASKIFSRELIPQSQIFYFEKGTEHPFSAKRSYFPNYGNEQAEFWVSSAQTSDRHQTTLFDNYISFKNLTGLGIGFFPLNPTQWYYTVGIAVKIDGNWILGHQKQYAPNNIPLVYRGTTYDAESLFSFNTLFVARNDVLFRELEKHSNEITVDEVRLYFGNLRPIGSNFQYRLIRFYLLKKTATPLPSTGDYLKGRPYFVFQNSDSVNLKAFGNLKLTFGERGSFSFSLPQVLVSNVGNKVSSARYYFPAAQAELVFKSQDKIASFLRQNIAVRIKLADVVFNGYITEPLNFSKEGVGEVSGKDERVLLERYLLPPYPFPIIYPKDTVVKDVVNDLFYLAGFLPGSFSIANFDPTMKLEKSVNASKKTIDECIREILETCGYTLYNDIDGKIKLTNLASFIVKENKITLPPDVIPLDAKNIKSTEVIVNASIFKDPLTTESLAGKRYISRMYNLSDEQLIVEKSALEDILFSNNIPNPAKAGLEKLTTQESLDMFSALLLGYILSSIVSVKVVCNGIVPISPYSYVLLTDFLVGISAVGFVTEVEYSIGTFLETTLTIKTLLQHPNLTKDTTFSYLRLSQ